MRGQYGCRRMNEGKQNRKPVSRGNGVGERRTDHLEFVSHHKDFVFTLNDMDTWNVLRIGVIWSNNILKRPSGC